MLKALYVKHFALIDDLEMTFQPGLSAMTGETGAGKSIILESLQLLFGKRSDQTMIRHGEKRALVKGVFQIKPHQMQAIGLPEMIEIEREIDQSGRHNMKINGEQTTLQRLKEVTHAIGSIHAQNDAMNLYDKSYYLELIDQMDEEGISKRMNAYLMDRSVYLEKKKHLESLKQKKKQSIEKQSFLEFQVEELSALHLLPDERTQLDEQIEKLKHHDRIMSQLKDAYGHLEEESFPIDRMYDASRALDKISHLDSEYKSLSERLQNAYYDVDDVKQRVFQIVNNLDFDEEAFNRMQDRSYELIKIEQKYGKTVNELMTYLESIQEELLLITDYDHYLALSETELKKTFEKAYQSGLTLSNHRQKLAKQLTQEMILELKDLDLDKAHFEIVFENVEKVESALLETGLDQVDFHISLNEGEPIKPLSKVASGGERARFMFALKSIYAKSNHLSMLILDEIDIGISGKTAGKVATKMQQLALTMQLLVITHLPQVAARAHFHYGIEKKKEKDRMVTRIYLLNDEMRIEKIALMLSDEKLTHFAIEQAKVLLGK